YDKEITQHGIYLAPAGMFVWHKDIFQEKRDLNFCKTLKWNQEWEDPEIVFIPVNVNAFHHSLLVYKKSDITKSELNVSNS
ncbi:MAG: hypothetical protein I3274_07175, partial [Candidatus Moeniiplasma glomeromycotorum]|nr:hypothetical protein [Candidatus Moeniiplasma glomeromycotorum]